MKKMLTMALLVMGIMGLIVGTNANVRDVESDVIALPEEVPEEVIENSEEVYITRDSNNYLTVTSPLGIYCLSVVGDYWGYSPILKGYLFYDNEIEDVYILSVNLDVESPWRVSLTTLKALCR